MKRLIGCNNEILQESRGRRVGVRIIDSRRNKNITKLSIVELVRKLSDVIEDWSFR